MSVKSDGCTVMTLSVQNGTAHRQYPKCMKSCTLSTRLTRTRTIMDSTGAGLRRSKSWTKEQREEFGRRMAWARERAGYENAASAYREIVQLYDLAKRTYYSHDVGERVPDDDELIEIYAQLFDVTVGFLLLREAEPKGPARGRQPVESVRERLGLNSLLRPAQMARPVNHGPVNQVLERHEIKPSQIDNIRYISVLSASDIKDLFIGNGRLRTASRERLPMPPHVAAGPRAYFYRMPSFDHSMVGHAGGDSFPPGTDVLIDPDRAIAPGDYLLCRPAGVETPVLRKLQSTSAYLSSSPHYPFKLVALNPQVAPIFVETAEDCHIDGRMIYTGRAF